MNIQDTTDLKQISNLPESDVKRKEIDNKYLHLFNSLGAGIFVHDMNGGILDANDHACRRYGYSYNKFKSW